MSSSYACRILTIIDFIWRCSPPQQEEDSCLRATPVNYCIGNTRASLNCGKETRIVLKHQSIRVVLYALPAVLTYPQC